MADDFSTGPQQDDDGHWKPLWDWYVPKLLSMIESKLFLQNAGADPWQELQDGNQSPNVLFREISCEDFTRMRPPITLKPEDLESYIKDFMTNKFGLSSDNIPIFFEFERTDSSVKVKTVFHEGREDGHQVADIIRANRGKGPDDFYSRLWNVNKREPFVSVYNIDVSGYEHNLGLVKEFDQEKSPASEPTPPEKPLDKAVETNEIFKAYLRLGMLRGILERFKQQLNGEEIDPSIRDFSIDITAVSKSLLKTHKDDIKGLFDSNTKLREGFGEILAAIGIQKTSLDIKIENGQTTAVVSVKDQENGGTGITHRLVNKIMQDYCSQPHIHMLQSTDSSPGDISFSPIEFGDLLEIGGLTRREIINMMHKSLKNQKYETVGFLRDYMDTRREHLSQVAEVAQTLVEYPTHNLADILKFPSMSRLSFMVKPFMDGDTDIKPEKRKHYEKHFAAYVGSNEVLKKIYGVNDTMLAEDRVKFDWYSPRGHGEWKDDCRIYIVPDAKSLSAQMPQVKSLIKYVLFEMAADKSLFEKVLTDNNGRPKTLEALVKIADLDDKELQKLAAVSEANGLSSQLLESKKTTRELMENGGISNLMGNKNNLEMNKIINGIIEERGRPPSRPI